MMDGGLDRETLRRAQRGDPAAFRALYEHHADVVYVFLRRLLRDDATTEDALQEVFMRVLRAVSRFDPEGAARLSTWILAIARNVALDSLRTARRHPGPTPDALAEAAAPAAAPDLRIALQTAIAALPDAQRTVFVLAEGCALSYEDIAEIEGVDIGTVRSRLHRAREALRHALGTQDHTETQTHDGRRHVRAT